MPKILISSCLLGQPVRYDGAAKQLQHPILQQWFEQGLLVSMCPEIAGGLGVPRAAAEQQVDGRVITNTGADVTAAFERGARAALALAQANQCRLAVLKARSPSYGNNEVYDGSFSGRLMAGEGVTASLLRQAGIAVFNEDQLQQAAAYFAGLASTKSPLLPFG
ncbi:DUF523 domain-containing protein [Neiella sp. HB171785]|uniref:DUF523 domain-containing protein n=1 Tax=Neiella litorisoli TaxID=2771431 RepID=A0A8J6UKZ9_9GAMM|nr:DUF523 domain-containing protein [Neiella litorisoli]MBD1388050.1 DUF523 domain-containing protein [Neiella litorisoli]